MDKDDFSDEDLQQFAAASRRAAEGFRGMAVAARRLGSIATVMKMAAHERLSEKRPDLYGAPAEIAEAAVARAAKR